MSGTHLNLVFPEAYVVFPLASIRFQPRFSSAGNTTLCGGNDAIEHPSLTLKAREMPAYKVQVDLRSSLDQTTATCPSHVRGRGRFISTPSIEMYIPSRC